MAELLQALENADSRPPRNWELREMSTNCYKNGTLMRFLLQAYIQYCNKLSKVSMGQIRIDLYETKRL